MSRSPSGVASLRARFEQGQQDNDTSPPSRGRSPAGSVTSEQSRPLSKIRTSFVAVEPSGRMSSNLEVPTAGGGTLDGVQESKIAKSKRDPKSEAGVNAQTVPSQKGENHNQEAEALPNALSSANPDKPVSTAEDQDVSMLPGDPKDESAVSGGEALSGETPGLGSILKGSPFEEEDKEKAETLKTTPKKSQPTESSTKGTKPATKADAKPPSTRQVLQQSKAASGAPTEARPSQGPKAQPAKVVASVNGKPKEPAKLDAQDKPKKGPPSAVQTQKDQPAKNSIKSPAAPRTPTSARLPSKATSTVASPNTKAAPAYKGTNQANEKANRAATKTSDTVKNVTRAPVEAAKAATTKPSMATSSTAKASKKATPSSTELVKPRPKSPTKSVRLPAAATAPTASSAAKHDETGDQPLRSLSRQSQASATSKSRTASLSKPTRAVRASLPANSKPADKPRSKPRASLAPNSAGSGSFLERMMRPTQSSAQKAHEKVEPTSPPRRNTQTGRHSAKSERKSGESSDVKSGREEEKPVRPEEDKPQPATEPADVEGLPQTDEASTWSNEVAREGENTAPSVNGEA